MYRNRGTLEFYIRRVKGISVISGSSVEFCADKNRIISWPRTLNSLVGPFFAKHFMAAVACIIKIADIYSETETGSLCAIHFPCLKFVDHYVFETSALDSITTA